MKLFLADSTARAVAALRVALPHALLLTGPHGVGLQTIARSIAGERMSGIIEPTDAKGEIDSTNGTIRVTQIRDLTQHAINKSRTDRVYIIDNADSMNGQAQNAFLKLLEEPAPHVHFILLAHNSESLLPTIHSRVQALQIPPIDSASSHELLDLLHVVDAKTRTQLLFLAEGLPAELHRLASDSESFAQKARAVTTARQLLQGTTLEKCALINELSTDRPRTLETLACAQKIIQHSLQQHPTKELIARADLISTTYDRIVANGYIRIQLARLVV